MRRIRALCLLTALAALQAPAVLAVVQSPGSEAHHHPGCPWEIRDEPCPHRGPAPAPGETAWAPCPPMETAPVLVAGPNLAPRAETIRWEVDRRPGPSIVPTLGGRASAFSPRPDPRPPRAGALAR